MPKTLPTERLLAQIKQRFYAPDPANKRFHRDRKMLLYALTWPAQWMDRRGLPIPSQAYEKLLTERLEAIAKHGNPQRYEPYFPRYLLKCIQDWFHHHGDDLYDDLKHIRNQLCDIEKLFATPSTEPANDIVPPLAQAHAVLKVQYNRKTQKKDARQLTLFPPS